MAIAISAAISHQLRGPTSGRFLSQRPVIFSKPASNAGFFEGSAHAERYHHT